MFVKKSRTRINKGQYHYYRLEDAESEKCHFFHFFSSDIAWYILYYMEYCIPYTWYIIFILKKIGFWVWVSGWIFISQNKPKTQKFVNLNPKPKNIYTQTQQFFR